jgi:sortase (surface protein transpeptidase)
MRRLRSLLGPILRPIARALGELFGLVPALLAGAGVFLVVAGLFYYLQPASAAPLASASAGPSGSIAAYSLPPITPGPSGSTAPQSAVATRIKIPALNIDLPVIASPANEEFPLCGVAEYMILDKPLGYPGLPQATYLYAHARTGMFWPLLVQSKVNNGAAMIGMWIEVYTDDNQRHVYEITRVIRHVPDSASAFDDVVAAKTDQLWLQTSEGPIGFPDKLQVVAQPVGVLAAAAADAHPAGKGNVCPGYDTPLCKTAAGVGCRRR